MPAFPIASLPHFWYNFFMPPKRRQSSERHLKYYLKVVKVAENLNDKDKKNNNNKVNFTWKEIDDNASKKSRGSLFSFIKRKSAEFAKAFEPAKTEKAARPAKPVKPVEPVKTVETTKPAKNDKAIEPVKVADPVKPDTTVEFAKPEKPAKPVKFKKKTAKAKKSEKLAAIDKPDEETKLDKDEKHIEGSQLTDPVQADNAAEIVKSDKTVASIRAADSSMRFL